MKFFSLPYHLSFLLLVASGLLPAYAQTYEKDVVQLVGALLHDTPLEEDLLELCDNIGGRVTGSEANKKAVEWGLQKFSDAGVTAKKEAFEMPGYWNENSANAVITGDISFTPTVVSRAFSPATSKGGSKAPLLYGGMGTDADFERLGNQVKDKYVLIETEELVDVGGLFKEYADDYRIEKWATEKGAKGVIYISSRPRRLMFRYFASQGYDNQLILVTMAREDGLRCLRVLQQGGELELNLSLDLEISGKYESHNVIAEIRGTERPDEVVVVGAHLDSWGLGTGANDNGCNVGMLIDIARQMKKLNIRPKRSIRFALWNGEEQGYFGSFGYTLSHSSELDKHVMAMSVDIGSGKINGFFTNGRQELVDAVEKVLWPVRGLGPFQQVNAPIVGTDNFDFMLQGVGNLVANHASANYGPHYHAASDTYDKILFPSLKVNSAIVAAVVFGFANMEEVKWKRQTRAEIEKIMDTTDLPDQMKMFNVWQVWEDGSRGRKK